MTRNSTNFADWRLYSTIKIWQVASILQGFDPRALGDVVDIGGDGADLSSEIGALISAISTGEVIPVNCLHIASPTEYTTVTMRSVREWMNSKGLHDIADQLKPQPTLEELGKSIKKNVIVATNRHSWPTIHEDFKRSRDNGLDRAMAPGSGMWYEASVLQWAKENNRIREKVVQANTWPPRSQ